MAAMVGGQSQEASRWLARFWNELLGEMPGAGRRGVRTAAAQPDRLPQGRCDLGQVASCAAWRMGLVPNVRLYLGISGQGAWTVFRAASPT